ADDRADLLMAQHLDEIGLLDVQDLTLEGQDRLKVGIATLLGGSASRITLDQEQLSSLDVLAAAIRQLAGQTPAFERAFTPREVARLLGSFARLRSQHALVEDRLGFAGMLFQKLPQLLVDHAVNERLDFRVQQLVLGLR